PGGVGPATRPVAATAGPVQPARAGHAATGPADGSLPIAGGDDAGSAEIPDTATASSTLLPALLTVPRAYHAAARLESGQVLIVGGEANGSGPLDSAELFDPATLSFHLVASALQPARAQPSLRG